MSPLARGVVSIAVALLVVLGVAALAMRGADDPVAVATPTPTPSPAATPTPDPGTPPPADDALETLAEIEEQVIAIRDLEAAEIGPPDLLTRDEFAAELRASFEEDYPAEDREADNITLRAMGLLTPEQDIGELQLQLLEQQVLGYYDYDEQRMVVVSDRGLDAEAMITYAHEYTHALQDSALAPLRDYLLADVVGADDEAMARLAVVEGDATVTMFLWAFQHLSPEEISEVFGIEPPDTEGIPDWLVQALTWPYEAGTEFVLALVGDPMQPDWDALGAAYEQPPASTAQILQPEKYRDGVQPVEIESVDLSNRLAEAADGEWREVDSTPIGEAFIGIWLEALGVAPAEARDAAAGWAGDRLTVVADDGEGWALSWRLAWETGADADEFAAAYESSVADLPFAAELVRSTETELLIRHASAEELLAALPSAD